VIEIVVNFLGLFGIFLAGFGILTAALKAMDFEGKILNMYKPSEVDWIFAIVILVLGIVLIVLAQYFAKKSEMV
jgi:uncharacterized membrane protein YidH (DUF202 family)